MMLKKKTPKAADHSQQTPYAGSLNGVPVETAPHVLVTGPTGRGKTTRVLAPGALLWHGPRVLVSSKTDFMKITIDKGLAHRGAVYVMDLAGEVDDNVDWMPENAVRVVSDPTALIQNDDDALAMASLLMKVGALGASDGGGGGGSGDAFWQTLAAQPMAALLLAGKASGEGMAWTVRAAGRPMGASADDPTPSWVAAIALIGDTSRHAEGLEQVIDMDPKLKDSLTATMKAGMTPWLLSNVTGKPGAVPFTPKMLEGPGEPTLYITAPADGVAAGAAVAAVEMVISHWRRGVERGLPRILLSIDEACNTCPLPKLPTYITEARGLGVACVIAVQSTNQMVLRWGKDGADVLREVFPSVLVLQGAPERELLENAAWWDGETDVWRESIDSNQARSMSAERVARTTATSLLPQSMEEGRLLLFGRKGEMVELPGIWQFA